LDKWKKILVEEEEGVPFVNTKGGDHCVDRFADRDTPFPKSPKVVGGSQSPLRTEHLKDGESGQQLASSAIVSVRTKTLQDFRQDDVADSERFYAEQ
jgi:hypothetical protein